MNFGYNTETAGSNSFQHASKFPNSEIQKRALQEFEALARKMELAGVGVKVFNDTALPHKPDAVFPNNWFSTHADGTVILYPMQTPSRRMERRDDIVEWLKNHFHVSRIIDLTHFEQLEKFLEGTGSMVFDHQSKTVYACSSPRTNEALVGIVGGELGYSPFIFKANDRNGREIYHTNVVMSVGEHLAVACFECVAENREELKNKLKRDGKELVEISRAQLENFAGNMLMLKSKNGQNFMVMSERARESLTETQTTDIQKHAEIISSDLQVIETTGGGSARCMMAEVFLKRKA